MEIEQHGGNSAWPAVQLAAGLAFMVLRRCY